MSRHRAVTVLLHPIALMAAYALLYRYGSANIGSMTALCLYWGRRTPAV
ncbi:hypothetical protein M5585_17125 [Serratia ureilytica]